MMLRATTTSGANSPFPAFTLPIICAGDRSGWRLLLDAATAPDFVATLRERQETLRQQFAARQQDMLSLDEARHRKPNFFDV